VIAVILVAIAALAYYRLRSATTPTAGNPSNPSANPPGAEGPNTTAITRVPPPVHPGSIATIGAIADPGATCTFAATDVRGKSVETGTGSAKADAHGDVAWEWHLDPHLSLGSYRLVVSCQPGTTSTATLVVT